MNIYITSTDTNSGKTVIAGGIAAVMQSLGYKTGLYKPVQTGAIDKGSYLLSPDLAFAKLLDSNIITHSTFMLKSKNIPVIGAHLENLNINFTNIEKDYNILKQKTDLLITESVGGLMTPIKNDFFAFHIPLKLNIPIIFVITPKPEIINHYLNEINTAKALGLQIRGVIINKYPAYSDNIEIKSFPQLLEKYSDAKILGLVRNFREKSIQENILFSEILNGIDLEDVFNMKIPKLSLY